MSTIELGEAAATLGVLLFIWAFYDIFRQIKSSRQAEPGEGRWPNQGDSPPPRFSRHIFVGELGSAGVVREDPFNLKHPHLIERADQAERLEPPEPEGRPV